MRGIIAISFLLFAYLCNAQVTVTSIDQVSKLKCGQSIIVEPFKLNFDEKSGLFLNMEEFEKASNEIWEAIEKIKCNPISTELPNTEIQKAIAYIRKVDRYKDIYSRHNLSNANKNGFSLREIADELNIDHTSMSKKDLSQEIYNRTR